jgi:YD repeat-containing protein
MNRMTLKNVPASASGAAGYVYDAENRLVSRSGGVTLNYDPSGRLCRRQRQRRDQCL